MNKYRVRLQQNSWLPFDEETDEIKLPEHFGVDLMYNNDLSKEQIKCNHTIGIWYDYDSTDIINIDRLKENIKDIKHLNKYKKEHGYDKVMGLAKEYSLEDYFNKNKNCNNFELFNYCPFCGEEIKLDKEQE